MNDTRDLNDAFRHRNLARIGRVLELPPRADAQRQAGWQEVQWPARGADGPRASFIRRHRGFAFATSGLAAAVLLVVWLAVGHTERVSAATIFARFGAALRQSLTAHLADIDLGTVQVSGDIVLDRAAPDPQDYRQYAEIHVLMRADNPRWNDIDAALVVCQTPTDKWTYCRGNGARGYVDWGGALRNLTGGLWPQRRPDARQTVDSSEYLGLGLGWRDFEHQPLENFGGMPTRLGLGIGTADMEVSFVFGQRQRAVVQELLWFLLDLSNAETAEEVIAGLREAAGDVRVEQAAGQVFVLHAARFTRLGKLELAPPAVPDMTEFLRQFVWVLEYDPQAHRRLGSTGECPPGLYETGARVVTDCELFSELDDQPDKLIAKFQERAVRVDVDRSSPRRWLIRVTGYPWGIDARDLEWMGEFVTALRDTLTLTIRYDAARQVVDQVEFAGIGPADGRITLNIGQAQLDPARLKSEYWVKPWTQIYRP